MRDAGTELDELLVRLDLACTRCTEQLNFLREMRNLAEESHLQLQEQALHILVGKLDIAKGLLARLVSPQMQVVEGESQLIFHPRKVKYAFKKDSLSKAVLAIETWQTLSDPQWFLMLRMNDRRLDEVLNAELSSNDSNLTASRALAIRQTMKSIDSSLRRLTPFRHAQNHADRANPFLRSGGNSAVRNLQLHFRRHRMSSTV